ncbi:MAG: FG-GAP repeat protein [Planctomycetota bacterium]
MPIGLAENFGYSVSIDDNAVIIGDNYDSTKDSWAGAAYIFTRFEKTWIRRSKLTAFDGSASDFLGWSVTINGDDIIVGAPLNDSNVIGVDHGAVYTQSEAFTLFDTLPTEWIRPYGGVEEDRGRSIVRTSDGGYALAGWTRSYGDLNQNYFLIKVDPNGMSEWSQTYGDTNANYGQCLVQTSDGGYAIAGGGFDELVKTDANGNLDWSQTYGGDASCVVETTDGGYAIAGVKDSNMWLVKTEPDGAKEWEQQYGSLSNWDYAYSLAQTDDDGYVLVGLRENGSGNKDVWVLKTDTVGIEEWDDVWGGDGDDAALSVINTSDGGFVVCGYDRSYLETNRTAAFLAKYDLGGSMEFLKRYYINRSYENSRFYSVAEAGDGGFIVGGYRNGYESAGSKNQTAGADFWIVKVDPDGIKEWERIFGGSGHDSIHSILEEDIGRYVWLGDTNSHGAGDYDFCISKLGPDNPLLVLEPDGGEVLLAGDEYTIKWETLFDVNNEINNVRVEFLRSIDQWDLLGDYLWKNVEGNDVNNTGSYDWSLPAKSWKKFRIRVSDTRFSDSYQPCIYDTTDSMFTLYDCQIDSGIEGDCTVGYSDLDIIVDKWLLSDCCEPNWCDGADIDHSGFVDMNDYAHLAIDWLNCGNPFDGNCDCPRPWPDCWDYPTQCYGDADGDGFVGGSDFILLQPIFGCTYLDGCYNPCVDFDRNLMIDIVDQNILMNNMNSSPPTDCKSGSPGPWPPILP